MLTFSTAGLEQSRSSRSPNRVPLVVIITRNFSFSARSSISAKWGWRRGSPIR